MAAGAGGGCPSQGSDAGPATAVRRGLWRGPLDGTGGHGIRCAGAGHHSVAVRAVPIATGKQLHGSDARRAAKRVRWARRETHGAEIAVVVPKIPYAFVTKAS